MLDQGICSRARWTTATKIHCSLFVLHLQSYGDEDTSVKHVSIVGPLERRTFPLASFLHTEEQAFVLTSTDFRSFGVSAIALINIHTPASISLLQFETELAQR